MAVSVRGFRLALVVLLVSLFVRQATSTLAGQALQLWDCSPPHSNNAWVIVSEPYPNHHIARASNNSLILDIDHYLNTSGAVVQLFHPNSFAGAYNQQFSYDKTNSYILSMMNGHCVTAQQFVPGAGVVMENCSQAQDELQRWTYDAETKQFRLVHSGNPSLCLDAGSTANCSVEPFSTYAYCNSAASMVTRIDDLLPRLTVAEKAQFLAATPHTNGGVPRLGVPPFLYGESLHGVNCQCGDAAQGSTGCPTSFPHALGLAATFNRTLWTMVGETIATEGRALHNQGKIGLSMWAPDINLFRDPRWGRGQEVPGEDPYLSAEYVAHYSRALQEGEDPRYLKLISSCKHFSAYDLENWGGVTRHAFNAIVSEQDLVEYYWVPFRSCVERAHAKSIMCSYNAVNGIPSCANSLFQNEIVREEWGFDGFFVSDCGAIGNIYANHNYTNSSETAAAAGLNGGTDTNCGKTYQNSLADAVNDGFATEAQLDVSVRRVMEYMFRLGYMDPAENQPYLSLGPADVDTYDHRQVALEAAQQLIVLLKNVKNTLPLSLAKVKSIALIGPQANATQDLLSNYHGQNTLVEAHSILAGVTTLAGQSIKINFVPGLESTSSDDTSKFNDVTAAAKGSDVAVVCIGMTTRQESEGRDRKDLLLPGAQQELVDAVLKVQPNTVVVLINGGPLAIDSIKENVPAILEAFYPGELGGDAVADVLFGKVNPSGRLPTTVYPASYTDRSYFDMNLRGNGGCTYLHYTGDALWEFGFGLSYTTFSYSWESGSIGESVIHVDTSTAASVGDTPLMYTVVVKNTGDVAGADSVLGFLKSSNQSDAPIRELFDFGRVYLQAGESATVHLTVSPQTLSLTDREGVQSIRRGEYRVEVGDLRGKFIVDGGDVELFSYPLVKERHVTKLNQ
ncbi:uncharacterized protein LOC135815554 [Sycon ciliatum]|uniref:uncharacterized protein LOC135815554 n=1 Tax=Sycon ciliatum TaxID=27933 RepID=UPI0031F61238